MEQTNNIPQQKKKSRLKLILIICVCSIIIIGLIVTGPILMQTFQVGSSNHANAALCWVGGIMIAIPIILLTIVCLILILKNLKKKDK
ncbi:MAG: hypothetical protein LBL60_01065 [Mycoplasmataceae bacterium]|nr:hypothetical protein [Mycoplasmataceae bacterium]